MSVPSRIEAPGIKLRHYPAKARVELQSLVDVIAGKPGPDGPFVAAARAEKILAELTPPTPQSASALYRSLTQGQPTKVLEPQDSRRIRPPTPEERR